MEHHEEEPLIYLVDPPVRRHHKRSAVQGECMYCIELDVGIVQISQGSFESVIRSAGLDSDICGSILHRYLRCLGFAEDIDIIGRTTAKVCMAYIRLKREEARIGLRINATTCLPEVQPVIGLNFEAVYLAATISRW